MPVPDLVIYLESSSEMANKRLQKRSDQSWRLFPDGYLEQIHQGYRDFFHVYDHSPIIIANIDELDMIHNEEHFEMLIDAIKNKQVNRHYLNISNN